MNRPSLSNKLLNKILISELQVIFFLERPHVSHSMVSCGRRFRRAFSIKSSVFQRNCCKLTIVFCGNATSVLELPWRRRQKRENWEATTLITKTETLKLQHTFWRISLPSPHWLSTDWNSNAITSLISNISVSLKTIVATSTSLEMSIESLLCLANSPFLSDNTEMWSDAVNDALRSLKKVALGWRGIRSWTDYCRVFTATM